MPLRQTLTMIVRSVAATGLAAGIVAVPVGMHLQHGVIPAMAHAANSGYPPALLSVCTPRRTHPAYPRRLLIAIAGALAPAAGQQDLHRHSPPRRITP
jgi:putative ABC transport system permease protein